MKELIDALHVIQDECKKHDGENGCKACPLRSERDNECAVTEWTPNTWKINDKVQKALL